MFSISHYSVLRSVRAEVNRSIEDLSFDNTDVITDSTCFHGNI
jgi:hypothetical protein